MIILPRLEQHFERRVIDAAAAREPKLAAYNVGRCVRDSWYVAHGYAPRLQSAESKRTTERGQALERWLVGRICEAIPHARRAEWKDDKDKRDCPPLPGRVIADAFVPFEDHDEIPVDVKTLSDYTFERAEKGDIGQPYEWQMECYARAYDTPFALLLGYEVSRGAMCEVSVHRSDERWAAICSAVATATGETMPERPYALDPSACSGCEGTGKTKVRQQAHAACNGTGLDPLGGCIPKFPCGYCAYRDDCWGELKEVATGRGPRFRPVAIGASHTTALVARNREIARNREEAYRPETEPGGSDVGNE